VFRKKKEMDLHVVVESGFVILSQFPFTFKGKKAANCTKTLVQYLVASHPSPL
jgi:hypothetical protein